MNKASDRFYTKLTEARETLLARRELRERVEAWWHSEGWGLPPHYHLTHEPIAAFCRQMATARYEDVVFYQLAREAGLLPLWLEYLGDVASEKNTYKRSLLVRHICSGRGKHGGIKLDRQVLACIRGNHSKRLDTIQVSSIETNGRRTDAADTDLATYHHTLQDMILPWSKRLDITNWLKSVGLGRAVDYYAASMSLFVAHGVLFEDYHGGESGTVLDNFTAQIFEPAFAKVEKLFGARPIIVPMPWRPAFAYYPANREVATAELAFSL